MRTASLILLALVSSTVSAQGSPPPSVAAPPTAAPPPATKLEAFSPRAGTLATFAYEELGAVTKFSTGSVSLDVRELMSQSGEAIRGIAFTVRESQYRIENGYIDADEIPELLSAIDVLLELKANPTKLANFERRYETKGELRVTAYNAMEGIRYSIRAGRVLRATVSLLTVGDMQKIKAMLTAGQAKIATISK